MDMTTTSSSPRKDIPVASWFHNLWNSTEGLSRLITLANWGIAASLLLGFAFTVLAIKAGDRKDELLKAADLAKANEMAAAQRETTEAQLALRRSFSLFARRSGERILNVNAFADLLKSQPQKAVEIRYKPDDTEAESFANDLCRALQIAKWPASKHGLKVGDAVGGMSLWTLSGITVFGNAQDDEKSFMLSLLHALPFGTLQAVATLAPELPKDKLIVVVSVRVKL